MKKFVQLFFIIPLIAGCTKVPTKDAVVRIGNTTISKAQFDAFEKVTRMYPTEPSTHFPGFRSKITHLIETEVLFRQPGTRAIKDSLKKSLDWKWKKRYYPAQIFLMEYLAGNLGVPESRINEYYEAHKDSFTVTIKGDSTKADSTYIRPLADVRGRIIDSLFIQDNNPDSAFRSQYDSLASEQDIRGQWIFQVRKTLPVFFMKKLYAEMYGTPYPDSLNEIFGEGKYITQEDLEIILSWLPESRRHMYSDSARKQDLIEWLVKWKLFSEYAAKLGHDKLPESKYALEYGWKINIVDCYVSKVLAPAVEASVSIDTSMMLFSLYDDNGYTFVQTDHQSFATKCVDAARNIMSMKIDSIIIGYRRKYPVTFLQNDWKDTRNANPDTLLKEADVLRDSGKTTEAKEAYTTLSKDFAFSPAGQNALIELAKLQTEQQLYTLAIQNYRRYLLLNRDESKRCNTFFMIGFIYDEYLDKPLHAETNYKWILKNSPECELADDAEFMMLHLSEPMSSVEELRDEAMRQGRKIDADSDEGAVSTEDTITTATAD